jgi:hypothetical protein
MWAAKRHVSPALVVIGKENRCGLRNDKFPWLSKGPVLAKGEFWGLEIEITGGVVISTPSATHLPGLPHQWTSLAFSYPVTSAPLLRNKVYSPR